MWRSRLVVAVVVFTSVFVLHEPAQSAVERYKVEADYLARLVQLGLDTVTEGFESSVWDGSRSTIVNPAAEPSVLSQGLLWEPAAKDVWGSLYSTKQHGLSTNNNWARSGQWGLFENHFGEAYPTTIRVSSVTPIYGIGGWFDTNPDGQSVGVLFENRTTANEPGYVLPGFGAMYPGDNPSFGHEFIGFIDPDGFTDVVLTGTLQVNEENVLEGGIYFGADDFTFGVPQGFITPITGDLNDDGYVGLDDLDIVLANWNLAVPPADPAADPTNDGFVGLDDLDVVLGNWNAGTPPTVGTQVPEPVTGVILVVGAAWYSRRRTK